MIPPTAVALDRLGYHRYWLTEHHGRGAFSASPLILTAIVAGLTTRLRTGPAGVLLHYHSPLAVAEDARMLEMLFPGRIDLGIARGVEGNRAVAEALLDGRPSERDYTQKVGELLAWVGASTTPADAAHVPPQVATKPEIWLLGTSIESAKLAASFGAHYAFSRIINDNAATAREAMRAYRESFRSRDGSRPQCSLALSFVCGATEAAARAARSPAAGSVNVLGDEEIVFDAFATALNDSGADELVLADVSERLEAKIASYERIALRAGITPTTADAGGAG